MRKSHKGSEEITYGSSETPSCMSGQCRTSSLEDHPVRKVPEGFVGSTEPNSTQFVNGGIE